MPTKKQRRRREKGRRHEYEEVYLDDAGNEISRDEYEALGGEDAPPPAKAVQSANGRAKSKPAARARPVREVPPPSWRRAARRAVIFTPILLVVIFMFDTKSTYTAKVGIAVFYGVMMVPFMYFMDNMMYRRFSAQRKRER